MMVQQTVDIDTRNQLLARHSEVKEYLLRRGLYIEDFNFPLNLLKSSKRIVSFVILSHSIFWIILFNFGGVDDLSKAAFYSSVLVIYQTLFSLYPFIIWGGFIWIAKAKIGCLNALILLLVVAASKIPRTVRLFFFILSFIAPIVSLWIGLSYIAQSTLIDMFSNWVALIISPAIIRLMLVAFMLNHLAGLLFVGDKIDLKKSQRLKDALLSLMSIFLNVTIGLYLIWYSIRQDDFGSTFILGLSFFLIAVQTTFPSMLIWVCILSVKNVLLALPHLVKIRANVLGLAVIGASLLFLNEDSWQMVTTLEWQDLFSIAVLLYLLPIILLLGQHRELISEEIKNADWTTKFHEVGSVAKPLQSTQRDIVLVGIKNILKLLFLICLIPLIVTIFAVVLFNSLLHDKLLIHWLSGFPINESFIVGSLTISYLDILRIKGALILAIISTGSTFVTLFTAKDAMKSFVIETFGVDIQYDMYLLAMHRDLSSQIQLQTNAHTGGT